MLESSQGSCRTCQNENANMWREEVKSAYQGRLEMSQRNQMAMQSQQETLRATHIVLVMTATI